MNSICNKSQQSGSGDCCRCRALTDQGSRCPYLSAGSVELQRPPNVCSYHDAYLAITVGSPQMSCVERPWLDLDDVPDAVPMPIQSRQNRSRGCQNACIRFMVSVLLILSVTGAWVNNNSSSLVLLPLPFLSRYSISTTKMRTFRLLRFRSCSRSCRLVGFVSLKRSIIERIDIIVPSLSCMLEQPSSCRRNLVRQSWGPRLA